MRQGTILGRMVTTALSVAPLLALARNAAAGPASMLVIGIRCGLLIGSKSADAQTIDSGLDGAPARLIGPGPLGELHWSAPASASIDRRARASPAACIARFRCLHLARLR